MHPLYLGNGIVETVLFFFVVLVYFYLPGKWILSKLHLTLLTPESIVLPIATGILIFSLATYITSWVHALPIALIPLLAIAAAEVKKLKPCFSLDKNHSLPFLVVTILAILFSLPVTLSGVWGNTVSYGSDDIYHLSYIHELKAHFPPENPGFAGVPLKGYHFFADFLIANVSTLSGISDESLFFHYFPLLVALCIGFGVYSLLFIWTKRKDAGVWGVFLAMFGGSFGFMLRLQGHPTASLTSVFGIDQPSSALLNWPFALSLVFVVSALLLLYHYLHDRKIGWLYVLALFIGLTPVFKIYAGIVLFSGFTFFCTIECLRKRYRVIGPFLVAMATALATYGVFAGRGNYLIFFPLWEPHKVLTDSLPWYGYEEKHYTYTKLGVIRGIFEIEAYGLFLYIFGNLGTRLFGMLIGGFAWLKRHKPPSLFALTMVVMTATSLCIPLFFIQSVKVFEIIQLSWYYPFFCALFGAHGLALISNLPIPKFARWLIIGTLIVMTIPSTYEIWTRYVTTPKVRHDLSRFAMYQYLQSHGTYDDTVLELPSATMDKSTRNIQDWYQYTSPTFTAFGNKRSYFTSSQIDFPNLDVDGRAAFLYDISLLASPSGLLDEDQSKVRKLKEEVMKKGIRYIYSPNPLQLPFANTGIKQVYSATGQYLYEVH